MISSLYIDGAVLWLAVGMFFLLFFGFIFFGSAYLKEKSRTERAEIELGLFKERFRNEIRKAYKRGFKSALSIKDTENEEKK